MADASDREIIPAERSGPARKLLLMARGYDIGRATNV